MSMVTIEGVSKVYGSKRALDQVSFNLEKGRIYGFIGENGAGKTTLIRMLAGLSEPTEGQIQLFGQTLGEEVSALRQKMGFMVERPIFRGDLTAKQNLELQMDLGRGAQPEKIQELLAKVGLEDIEDRAVKDFSLGMKQRVGIAMTLVNDPELLVLDEPVNGLDPVGMVEVRKILKKLNEEDGLTIFLSSHILTELFQLATDYIIIHKGRIIRIMSAKELAEANARGILVEGDDLDKLRQELAKDHPHITGEPKGAGLVFQDDRLTTRQVAEAARNADVLLTHLSEVGENLEEFYLNLLGGQHD